MTAIAPDLQARLSQAFTLGGSPCSGKSTVAERLSAEFNLLYYRVDDYQAEHVARCRPERHPVMFYYARMSWDERWSRPVWLQVEELFAFYRERQEMILQDLEQLDWGRPLLLEGTAFLPEIVEQWRVRPDRTLYFVPTLAFQRYHYRQRPWIRDILQACRHPQQAFDRWMMRDHLFGREILRQARARQYGAMVVDGREGIEALVEAARSYLRLA